MKRIGTFLAVLALLTSVAHAQQSHNNAPGVQLRNEGVVLGQVLRFDFVGAGIDCVRAGILGTCTVAGGSFAPVDAQYWVGAADGTLTNEKNLGALGTGLVINTAGVPSAYAGVTCTNQVLRILDASGSGTCVTITSAYVDSSLVPSTRTISTTAPLSGGGDLSANRTLACPTCVTQAYATVQNEGTPLTQRSTVNFTGAGIDCADSGGITVCTASGGGPGSANTVEVSVNLGTAGGLVYTATVTGQAWVTGTSVIACSPFGTTADGQTPETVAASGVQPVVSNRVAGTGFDLSVYTPHGATGTYRFHCTGA